MNLLFIGDIVGKGGRRAVRELTPELRREHQCHFVVANGENAAGGAGLSASCVKELLGVVDVVTTGDHVWDQRDFVQEVRQFDQVLRPANASPLQPGRGWGVFRNPAGGEVAVVNLQGRIFMKETASCPFATIERILAELPATVRTVVVDLHAEATSEKAAMARFLDGRVTAVIGTHTHVQTADAVVLPGGTAFLTDVGMVGSVNSVLGRTCASVIHKFTTGMPTRLPVEEVGIRLHAAVVGYDPATGRANAIRTLAVDAGF
jgi:metallophosphoesterase (TIGR00282 family)